MRKIQLLLLALVLFHFSCEPHDDVGITDDSNKELQQFHTEFQQMFERALFQTEKLRMAQILESADDHLTIRIDRETISQATSSHLKEYFSGYHNIDKLKDYRGPQLLVSTDYVSAAQRFEHIVDTTSVFNEAQKGLIRWLSHNIKTAKSPDEGFELVSAFKQRVISSSQLRKDEKLLLIELASGSMALLDFINHTGLRSTQMNLNEILGTSAPFGRTGGCSVDWRNVWMDGVVGLVSGATWGGYIGATAGTFTVPVLGTATGAIGGAVFGGASGFISGVSYGVVSNLLTSCFRKQGHLNPTFANCDQAWQAYMDNEISSLPSGCFEISIQVKGL